MLCGMGPPVAHPCTPSYLHTCTRRSAPPRGEPISHSPPAAAQFHANVSGELVGSWRGAGGSKFHAHVSEELVGSWRGVGGLTASCACSWGAGGKLAGCGWIDSCMRM
eukprot:366554-Chlamydomonas_euryale.AAC.6